MPSPPKRKIGCSNHLRDAIFFVNYTDLAVNKLNQFFCLVFVNVRRCKKMSVFKIEKNNNYTVMSNYHLRDKNLSYKAKGLLSFIDRKSVV